MALPKGLNRILQQAAIKRSIAKAAQTVNRGGDTLGESIPTMESLFKQAVPDLPPGPMAVPTEGAIPRIGAAPGSQGMIPEAFNPMVKRLTEQVGEDEMPEALLNQIRKLRAPGAPIPTMKDFGVVRTDLSETGQEVAEGLGNYPLNSSNREDILATFINSAKTEGKLPFKSKASRLASEDVGEIIQKVGTGEGNLGKERDFFSGLFENKRALYKTEVATEKALSSLEKLKGKKPENFLALIDETVEVYDKFFQAGKRKDFRRALGAEKAERGELMKRFYDIWIDYRTDKSGTLAKFQKQLAPDKFQVFKQTLKNIEAEANLAGLLDETKKNAELIKNAKAVRTGERVARNPFTPEPETRPLTGPREKSIEEIDEMNKKVRSFKAPWRPIEPSPIPQNPAGKATLEQILRSREIPANVPNVKPTAYTKRTAAPIDITPQPGRIATYEKDRAARLASLIDIARRQEMFKRIGKKGYAAKFRRHSFLPEGVTTAAITAALLGDRQ